MDKVWLTERTAVLVSAYVARNSLPAAELPTVINHIYSTLSKLHNSAAIDSLSAVSISKTEIAASLGHDRLVSFIDGKSYRSLKRHLTAHGLSPESYRARYNLPADYPMISPGYSAARSRIAKQVQFGLTAA